MGSSILGSGRSNLFGGSDRFPSLSSSSAARRCEEEALAWAAIERLPTYERLRTSILNDLVNNQPIGSTHNQIDVTNIPPEARKQLIDRLLGVTDQDNERFLLKLRQRLDGVGIIIPEIEIRFQDLNISADVYVGSRALPTLINWTVNIVEDALETLRLRKTQKKNLTILHDISGIVKSGRLTLLLGPPASGKTTLLLALTGKLQNTLKVEGEVKYNGHALNEFVPERTSTYISQHDTHMGEMTVRETLNFSARCQGVGSRYDVLTELSRREKQLGVKPDSDIDVFMKATAIEGQETSVMTDYVLKILGLDICADTMVGDSMRRGISGGQKKRVTTGEMMVGGAKVFLMDEISTGLDSSTTFQIVRCFSQFVHVMRTTMVISLLQPAPETFELFDDVILLSEGYIVYQGPREYVLEFFENMGFKCPERKGVADFLQEVTSRKDQEQYWCNRTQAYQYVSVKEFADAFQSFHVGANLNAELSIPYDKTQCHPAALATEKYGLSKAELFKACFDRQVLLMKRNAFVHIFKFFQITAVATLAMTIYLRTKMHHRNLDDGSVYFGVLFLGLVMNMFNGIAGMALTIAKLPVFYKQRDFMFYPAWAYSLPIWISEVPSSFVESVAWIALTYYTVDFAPNPNRCFRQFLLYVILHQTGLALFRFIAGLARNLIVANSVGVFALLLTFVFGGYIISREDIKGWWIWAYWISPLSYAQNAVSVNEFLASRWQETNNHIGMKLLQSRGLFTNSYWYWIGVAALTGFASMFNIFFTLALQYLNPIGNAQAIVDEDELEKDEEQEMQNLPLERSVSLSTQRRHETQTSVPRVKSKGMILPFQPLSLTFHNVNYYVDMPAEMKKQGVTEQRLQLLREVSGSFRPGILTALVGESGAGKTTLMDVLAGRKTGGYIEGSITISGYPKKQETFARISGYCEQTDIHSPYVTVYESLVYSAWLRLGEEVDSEKRKMFVKEVMDLVEMNNLSGALVGFPGVNGLSTEQRKRLTIAVELVANPSIIFMDEPTSGLDARAAAIVMRTVRNTVDTGRTVVCTIHQPSIDIFEAFDELVLMKRGGQMIYVGPLGHQSQALVDYLEAIEGVPKITPGYNPATWMLEVTSVTSAIRLGVDFAELYRNSSLYQRNEALIQEISKPLPDSKDLSFERQFAQPFAVQTMACLWKQHWSYWRNPQYNSVRFFFTLACGLLFGTAFWRMGKKTHRQQDILNAMGSMFAAILFLGFSNVVSVLPVVDVERTVFYREKAAGMYSALPYAFAQVLIEVPYIFVQTVVYGLIVYAMIDFRWTAAKFFWYFFMMFFTLLYTTYYGMMTVGLTPNSSIASVLSTGFIAIWMVFCGFLLPRPRIPVWWRWYYWVSPFAWTLYGLIASQFGDNSEEMVMADGGKQQVNKFLRSHFGYRHDFMGPIAGATMSFAILFALIFALSIKVLNFQTR